ncbi:MAG: hypothetical protein KGL39_14385 [Patescibacteria group bacterium]|nr:hypothetical protein [Patescibacteria group bacterium]
MKKMFVKKPVVVTAEQWFPGKQIEGVINNPTDNPMLSGEYYVETLEGFLRVSPGDWIITGIKGEKYPCKPDIFEATYAEGNQQDASVDRVKQ